MNSRKAKQVGRSIALTERDRLILSALGEYVCLTREQLSHVCGFSSLTRANTRLAKLVSADFLSRVFLPTKTGSRLAVYGLGRLARVRGIRALPRRSILLLDHQLAINDLRLAFHGHPSHDLQLLRWFDETALRKLGLGIVPDGYAEYTLGGLSFAAFVEIDRGSESLSRFKQKVETYCSFAHSGQFQQFFKRRFFRVLVTATSRERVTALARITATVTSQIFWFAAHEDLVRAGPLAPIWRRPTEHCLQSLTSHQ